MAYTKILVIHNRLDKCVGYTQDPEKTSLEAAIDYALDREKTEQTCFETAVNCDRESVYADMMDTKRRWGKEGRKRKGYHIIQSFAPGEVTPDQAHAVGVEFARRLLGDRYEAVVSTHLNKAHLHSHIVFNSVSFVDGAMYRDQLKDYYGGDGVGIRGTSDAICREHGLSIIEPSEPLGGPVSRAEWEAARQGKATVRDLIRQDVDEAIRQAYTYQSFLSQLRRMGYRVKTGPRVKHTAILPPGGKGYIRLDSLKDGYTEADIQARLAAVRSGEAPPDTPPTTFSRLLEPGRRYRVRGGMPRRPRKLTGFQALCFQYLCLLGACPWPPTMTAKIWSWPSIPLSQTARHLRPSPLRWPTPASTPRGPTQTMTMRRWTWTPRAFPISCAASLASSGTRRTCPAWRSCTRAGTPSSGGAPWIRSRG